MNPKPVRDRENVLPEPERMAKAAVEAAVWAPSIHNTHPWWFGSRGSRINLHAATLTTVDDTRKDWLRVGQTLP